MTSQDGSAPWSILVIMEWDSYKHLLPEGPRELFRNASKNGEVVPLFN
jgi:hypothetical protein